MSDYDKANTLQRGLFKPKLTPIRTPPRPSRNKPCPCNSGIKFKRCCKDIATLCETLEGLIAGAKIPDEDLAAHGLPTCTVK